MNLHPFALALLSIALVGFSFEWVPRNSPWLRVLACALSIALTLRYMGWRLLHGMPHGQNPLQTIWAWLFVTVEMGVMLSSILTSLFLSRHIDRSPIADARANSRLAEAPTDVFIATYNESADILERTMVGALAIEHSDLRVWILDDGNRAWVRELAESLGVHYVARVRGKHAKAGNVNNGVAHALASGRKPEFFLLLDADFVPHRTILRRVLPLFEEGNVGIVQTPQHFFNHDPVQSNLLCTSVWPDEQRLFFNVLLPAKDAWGAAFCCGTSAVFRIEAFLASGGMATETVTEDMLTTFKFGEYGYRTIFLNERLSLGLAPESLSDYISQRSRWCLGAIQQIFTPWSFSGRARLSLINRISFLDTILYWMFGAAFKLMLILAPVLFWFTGTSAIHASLGDLCKWLLPMVAVNLMVMNYLSGKRVLPIMSDVTQILSAIVICRTVATALIRPFGRPFKVTAKGLSSDEVTVQWQLLWPFLVLVALTGAGIMVQVGPYGSAHRSPGYVSTLVWSLLNIVVLGLAAAACIELPKRRRDERFVLNQPALVRLRPFLEAGQDGSASADGCGCTEIACTVADLSLGGASIRCDAGWQSLWGPAELVVRGSPQEGMLSLPFTVVQRPVAGSVDQLLRLQFDSDPGVRRALIRKLFTGEYHKEIREVHASNVFLSLARALFS